VKLYFVRHGESVGNVGGDYSMSVSGDLTARGREQAEVLVSRLAPLAFDAIIVSPLERTVHTILPYLMRTDQTAEVWPEIAEMRGRKDVDDPPPPEVRHGPQFEIPEAARSFLRLRDEPGAQCLPPPGEAYAEGQRRVRLACERLMKLYGGRDATVLLVGHACSGARLLECLMKIEMDGRFQHLNTGLTIIEQKANGDFIMRCMSRVPDAQLAGR